MNPSAVDPIEMTKMRIRCLRTAWEMAAAEGAVDADNAKRRYDSEVTKLAHLEAAERGRSTKSRLAKMKQNLHAMHSAKASVENAFDEALRRAETLEAAAKTMAHEWQEYLSAVSRATAALSPFPTQLKANVGSQVPSPREVAKLVGRVLHRSGLDSRLIAVLPSGDGGHTATGYVAACAERVASILSEAIAQNESPSN